MIGGRDIIIPVSIGATALRVAVRAVIRLWPHAVLEDAESGESLAIEGDLDFAGRGEILVFRDEESARLWDHLGADPSLDGTLIHLLISDGELTVAVDATPPAEIKSFVKNLRNLLKQEMLAKQT